MDNEENQMEPSQEVVEPAADKAPVKIGAILVVLLGVVCLLVVVWFIISIWMAPSDSVEPVVTETPEETYQQPVYDDEEIKNPTVVPDRNPEILGLRIDRNIGRLFIHPTSGQTLYLNLDGGCVGECLDDWQPYLASAPVVEGGDLTTVERTDNGALQYAWKGYELYLYKADTEQGFMGDGYNGTWRIARP